MEEEKKGAEEKKFSREELPMYTRLKMVGKKYVDLLPELRKRGYPKMNQIVLSRYVNKHVVSPQAHAVLDLCETILKKWESEAEAKAEKSAV